jgi:hypothetical protein
MALTKATYSMIEGQPVNVFDFGAVGDGSIDDTAAIQAAIDTGRSVYFPAGTYKVSGLTVEDKNNVSYYAHSDATITNVGITTTNQIFRFVGTLENITWAGLNIVGSGIVESNNSAFGCSSGQFGSNLTFKDLSIKDTMIGISLNADLSGSFNNCIIDGCHFTDIVGDLPGEGYAVHLPFAYNTIVTNCVFTNVGRHDVYVPRGGRVTVSNCHSIDHRKDNASVQSRPAFLIARSSSDCTISNCVFENFSDGAVLISGQASDSLVATNNIVIGCTFKTPKNIIPCISIGEQTNISTTSTNGVIIEACTFDVDYSVGISSAVTVFNGKNIHVRDCFIKVENVTSNYTAIQFGSNSFSPGQGDVEYVSSTGCVFDASGTSGELRAVISEGYLGSNVDKTITVDNTQFYIDGSLNLITWHSPSYAFANSGVQGTGRYGDIGRGMGTAAPIAGTWSRGDIVWNIIPSAGGTMGWVCTTAGTPGTWKTFGTIAV